MSWYGCGVDKRRLDQLLDLLDGLDTSPSETVGTSIRIPARMRDAIALATDMGLAASTTELTIRGLRDTLEAFAQRAVLDAHYRRHPKARPSLAEVALAQAEIDGNPLAGRPDLLEEAATRIRAVREDPTPDDVLVFAAGLAAGAVA